MQTFKSKASRYGISVCFFSLTYYKFMSEIYNLDLKLASNSDLYREIKLSWRLPFSLTVCSLPMLGSAFFWWDYFLWRWQHYLCQIISSVCSRAVQLSSSSSVCFVCTLRTHILLHNFKALVLSTGSKDMSLWRVDRRFFLKCFIH